MITQERLEALKPGDIVTLVTGTVLTVHKVNHWAGRRGESQQDGYTFTVEWEGYPGDKWEYYYQDCGRYWENPSIIDMKKVDDAP